MRYLIILILLFSVTTANAVSVNSLLGGSAKEEPAAVETPKDELGRNSPQEMVEHLRKALAHKNYIEAAKYLNLSGVPKSQRADGGEQMAADFHSLLDQSGWLKPANMISDLETGDIEDGQPEEIERIGGIRTTKRNLSVMAERITPKDAKLAPYWVVSSDTIVEVPGLITDGGA